MRQLLEFIDQQWGSVSNYLHQACNFTYADQYRLRKNLMTEEAFKDYMNKQLQRQQERQHAFIEQQQRLASAATAPPPLPPRKHTIQNVDSVNVVMHQDNSNSEKLLEIEEENESGANERHTGTNYLSLMETDVERDNAKPPPLPPRTYMSTNAMPVDPTPAQPKQLQLGPGGKPYLPPRLHYSLPSMPSTQGPLPSYNPPLSNSASSLPRLPPRNYQPSQASSSSVSSGTTPLHQTNSRIPALLDLSAEHAPPPSHTPLKKPSEFEDLLS